VPLRVGIKFGPYEIVSSVASGGMGEVYRARDTRLGRDVAIKVLPEHLSSDPALKARFDREARLISGLNHPNICHLYDIGSQGGTDFLVMELLQGETLADRLQRGPLALEQIFEYGSQVADALDKAHKNDIVHRDLKPGNIMLTEAGAKLLDFGLAKPALAAAATVTAATASKPLTGEGYLLGTYQYMAPEQIEGKEADARSDIFAFGAVLYEMATGKRAFSGKSQVSVMSAILEKDPEPISNIGPVTPSAFDDLVRACLEKNPDDRYSSAHDVRVQLKRIAEAGLQARIQGPIVSRPRNREWLGWGAAVLLILVAGGFALLNWRASNAPQQVTISYLLAPDKHVFGSNSVSGPNIALAPDGRAVVYAASTGNAQALWVQLLDTGTPRELAGTENGNYPFWSPDNRAVAFFAEGKLKRINIRGGPVQIICDAPNGRGGSWSTNGTIVFAPELSGPLAAVSASGGVPRRVTQLDATRGENGHRWPWFLPDGKHFLFTAQSSRQENYGIFAGALDSMERKPILTVNSNGMYAPPGYLLFERDGVLMAQSFNRKQLRVEGEAHPIAEKVVFVGNYSLGGFSVSESGNLVYLQGTNAAINGRATWVDRTGKALPRPTQTGTSPSLSPDGKTLALEVGESSRVDVWLVDLGRNVRTRFSFTDPYNFGPIWSPDGREIAFIEPGHGIYAKPVDNSTPERQLFPPGGGTPLAWSSDGKYLLYRGGPSAFDIFALPLRGEPKPFEAVKALSHSVNFADFSPDAKWLTYQTDESGTSQIYVAPFGHPGGRWQVSPEGGSQPLWRGNEIFFFNNGRLWAADVREQGSGLQLGAPHALFDAALQAVNERRYDVSRDGKVMVLDLRPEEQATPLNLLQNWTAALKK